MISYADALQHLMDAAWPMPVERVDVAHAEGRVLAEAVGSVQDLPPFDNSAMDGFALRADGVEIAAGSSFTVQGWQAAGDAAVQGGKGAWEIMTGAHMPAWLDSVVPVEQVEVLEAHLDRPLRIRLREAVRPGQHVRLRGQDVAQGEVVLPQGTTLDVNAVTLLHALGITTVQVPRRPPVAVITTGKELVSDGAQALEPGQIRDSNRPYLVRRLQQAGADVVWQGAVGDEPAMFLQALDQATAAGARVLIRAGMTSFPMHCVAVARASSSTRSPYGRASRCCSRGLPMARCTSACQVTRFPLRWGSASSWSRCCGACSRWWTSRRCSCPCRRTCASRRGCGCICVPRSWLMPRGACRSGCLPGRNPFV